MVTILLTKEIKDFSFSRQVLQAYMVAAKFVREKKEILLEVTLVSRPAVTLSILINMRLQTH
jgi:hypothetical protein